MAVRTLPVRSRIAQCGIVLPRKFRVIAGSLAVTAHIITVGCVIPEYVLSVVPSAVSLCVTGGSIMAAPAKAFFSLYYGPTACSP